MLQIEKSSNPHNPGATSFKPLPRQYREKAPASRLSVAPERPQGVLHCDAVLSSEADSLRLSMVVSMVFNHKLAKPIGDPA
jgi:hypothetical protein